MQLEEEGCLSVPGFNATVVRPAARRASAASIGTATSRRSRRAACSRARSSTRWTISTAWCSSTGCAASSATSSSGKIQKLTAHGQMVTHAAPLRIVYFGTPEFAVPTLRRAARRRRRAPGRRRSSRSPTGRRGAASGSPPTADQGAGARQRGVPVLQPERLQRRGFLAAIARSRARPRRGRRLRQAPARRAAGDSAARHDQRPRVAAAAVARRRAGSPRRDRRANARPASRSCGW